MVNNLPQKGSPLEDYTWEQISQISRAGKASEYWNIGDTKTWVFNKTVYQVQIVDFDRDEVNEPHTIQDAGGKTVTPYPRKFAGITFELCGLTSNKKNNLLKAGPFPYNSTSANPNYINYDTSTINTIVNELIKDPSIVKSGISNVVVPVSKKTTTTNETTFIRIGGDYFFIPSVSELIGVKRAPYDEGEQYALYKQVKLGTTGGTSLRRLGGGSIYPWWTRTPQLTKTGPSDKAVYAINQRGELQATGLMSRLYIAPLFCV